MVWCASLKRDSKTREVLHFRETIREVYQPEVGHPSSTTFELSHMLHVMSNYVFTNHLARGDDLHVALVTTHWAGTLFRTQLSRFKRSCNSLKNRLCGRVKRQLPIFPWSYPHSIMRAEELNFRVRDGNGCTLFAIVTGSPAHTGGPLERV